MASISNEYGFVLATGAVLYLSQQLLATIYVVRARMATGIKAPTLYPRDSEIKALKLSDDQVTDYMNAQRSHQHTVEFSSVFLPLFLAAGLVPEITMRVAYAGASVAVFRILGIAGYQMGARSLPRRLSGLFHVGELYILYLCLAQGISMARASGQMPF